MSLILLLGARYPLLAQSELQKALDEFKTQSRAMGLRSDSGAQTATNKTSTQWHGRIYENLRNDFLDAIPHQIAQLGGKKAVLRRHQFGFNVSGPVVIPKLYNGGRVTYFSLSYEGVRDHTARSFLQTIATPAERTGNFSGTVDQAGLPLPLFDPDTTAANPAFNPALPVSQQNLQYLRTPFPNNRIDQARLSTVATRALEFYPMPNAAVGPFDRNNYFLVTPQTNNADGIIVNVDHTLHTRHRFSLNYNYTYGFNTSAAMLPTPANPASADRESRDPYGSVSYTFTQSPQTIWKTNLYLEHYTSGTPDQADSDFAGKIGLRGSSPAGFPIFTISPYVAMGRSYPRSRYASTYMGWSNSLSSKHGKHSLTFTLNLNRSGNNSFDSANPAGSFRFDEGLTSLPGITGTGHSFASFLLGLAGYAEKSYVYSPSYMRSGNTNFSFKEQYQARKGLTITVGGWVGIFRPRTEKYDRQSTIDLTAINPADNRPGAMIVTGRNGVGRAFQSRLINFEPNVSVAWNVMGDSKTVLRLSYNRYHNFGWSSSFAVQAFNAAPVYISPNTQLQPAIRLSDGLPPLNRPLPDLRPEALNDTNADVYYRGKNSPTFNSGSFSLERQLPFSTMVTASLNLGSGRDMWVGNSTLNLDAVPISALSYRDRLNDEAFNRSLRPFPQFKSLNTGGMYPMGRYRQETGSIAVEKRATAGLSLSFRYAVNKRRDDYSNRQDYFNRRNEWAWSSIAPQTISLTYMYELPIGRGKPYLRFTGWRRHVVDAWSISGSSSYSSGIPLMLRPQFNNTGGVISNLRVNVVPGVDPSVSNPGPDRWFNPLAFDQPPDFTLGNASRADPRLRGPISQNHDVSASKRFTLPSDRSLEFNAVALNFLNHANWNSPDVTIGPRNAPNINAGRIIGSTGGRVLQVGLKLSF